jgi:NAD-dependent dihydropyrimidine dehydrogenase PreA subunit
VLLDGLQTALRMLPWPTEPGLRAVGNPGDLSPVLLTCNYDLTVRRVVRALDGVDAWLVVAPSQGINVWCAASGGHLGTHQVVTALKTSGVAEQVRHRRAILPQLAATGVRAQDVSRRCGWRVHFGPVNARDLPRYLAGGREKTEDMRRVRFGMRERLEMAAAWGVPGALIFGGVAAVIRPAFALPLAALALLLALAVFTGYDRIPGRRRWILTGAAALAAFLVALGAGAGVAGLATAALAAVVLASILTYDYAGSTPVEGGSHFEERAWHVALDLERCQGAYSCWQVCPAACFEKPAASEQESDRRVRITHAERCLRCGACIVQCSLDALAFEAPGGSRIEPDVIRRFKLNLMGQRSVDAS